MLDTRIYSPDETVVAAKQRLSVYSASPSRRSSSIQEPTEGKRHKPSSFLNKDIEGHLNSFDNDSYNMTHHPNESYWINPKSHWSPSMISIAIQVDQNELNSKFE